MDIQEITLRVEQESVVIRQIMANIEKVIVGQKYLIERMIIGLLCEGHLLLEGLPGLAKTTAVKSLATTIQTTFQRIQFTPDLLPADILGTQYYRPDTATFEIKKGPVFHNIILADEINRAPAKVQSALLEAMQELQITIGETTFTLQKPFLVLATQNPIEQEGTYPLPEAQIDRFMMKIKVDYPSAEEEREIMTRVYGGVENQMSAVVDWARIARAGQTMRAIHMEDRIMDYVVRLVRATRAPEAFGLELAPMIHYGASPRASIWLGLAARAHAFVSGRGYVTPQDVKTMAPDILRHRIILSYEAEAEEKTTDDLIQVLLERIEVP
ncbi:MAG: MoxR family ATPase [Deltaproteobacteria bacterium]|nr:MoxR family ATPase [Deltaproteobacteria bacterium]